MPSFKLANYLRTHRKRLGLSQDEVTFLLGRQSTALVSVHEQFRRLPCLRTLLAYTVILQIPAHELFAGEYQEVEQAVSHRAKRLIERLATEHPDQRTARKLVHLKTIVTTAASRP